MKTDVSLYFIHNQNAQETTCEKVGPETEIGTAAALGSSRWEGGDVLFEREGGRRWKSCMISKPSLYK